MRSNSASGIDSPSCARSSFAYRSGPRTWLWSPRAASFLTHPASSAAAFASASLALREARALRVVAGLAHDLADVAAQVRREPGEVARRYLGDGLRQRRRQVLAHVPHLAERRLLLIGEAAGALLERRVLAIHVGAHREERVVELRALARRVQVDQPEEPVVHPALELREVERSSSDSAPRAPPAELLRGVAGAVRHGAAIASFDTGATLPSYS